MKILSTVGLQIGTTTMENNVEATQKIQNRTTVPSRNSTSRYIPKGNEKRTDVYTTTMFIAALFTIAEIWKPPKCPSTGIWLKRTQCTYKIGYNLAIRKKDILPSAVTWMNLKHIRLSEMNQRKTNIVYYYLNVESKKSPICKKKKKWFPGERGGV